MKDKQARRRGGKGVSVSVSSHRPVPSSVRGRAILGSYSVLRGVAIASSSSSPASKQAGGEGTWQGQDERQRGAAEAWRSRRSYLWIVSRRANKNKQARQERRAASPHLYHLTAQRVPSHTQSAQSPRPATSTRETTNETETTSGRDGKQRRRERRANDWANNGTKTYGPQDDKQATRRRTRRPARRERDEGTRRRTTREKQAAWDEDRRMRRTKRPHFLTSRPTPSRLFSLI